jgi:hypothetical protein
MTVVRTSNDAGQPGAILPSSQERMPMAVSSHTGRLFVAGEATVFAYDLDTFVGDVAWIASTGVPEPIDDLRVSDDGKYLWVLTGRIVWWVDLADMTVERRVQVTLDTETGPAFADADANNERFESIENFVCAC